MLEVAVNEFPFVASLPKREKSKLAKLWDHLAEVRAVTAQKGTLIPQHMVADLLNVSGSRVGQLVDDGRLDGIEVHGIRYVTADSIEACARVERKRTGRPRKSFDNRALWKASVSGARNIVENISK